MHRVTTLGLVALLAAFALPSFAAKDDKDKVTLVINATCEANVNISDTDFHLSDKCTVTLNERATYRIVDDGGYRGCPGGGQR